MIVHVRKLRFPIKILNNFNFLILLSVRIYIFYWGLICELRRVKSIYFLSCVKLHLLTYILSLLLRNALLRIFNYKIHAIKIFWWFLYITLIKLVSLFLCFNSWFILHIKYILLILDTIFDIFYEIIIINILLWYINFIGWIYIKYCRNSWNNLFLSIFLKLLKRAII